MTKISNVDVCRVMLFAWASLFIASSVAETLEVSSEPAQEAIARSINAALLGHEGQHFADLGRFSDLQPWELEYRAKFTELWMAKESLRDLLVKFSRTQSDEPDSPHTFANKRVLNALRVRLQEQGVSCAREDLLDVPANVLRTAARDALVQDTAARAQVRLSSYPSR